MNKKSQDFELARKSIRASLQHNDKNLLVVGLDATNIMALCAA